MNDVAITDAILALIAGVQGFRLLYTDRGGPSAGVGLLLVALAATFGAGRFFVAPDDPEVAGSHVGVTRLASLVGLPLVGVGYASTAFVPQHARAALPYAFVVLLLLAVALIGVDPWITVIAGAGMAAVIVGAGGFARYDLQSAGLGGLGAAGVLVSGLVINGEGTFGPLSRVAWFHLGLAGATWALGQGMIRQLRESDQGQP